MKKNICVVAGCDSADTLNDSLKFHQIPKDTEVRKKWLKAINRTEPEINKRSRVCSKHFKTQDYAITRFNYTMGGKNAPSGSKSSCEFKALKNEAVPNTNLPQKSTFKIKISKKETGKQIKVEEVKIKEEKPEKVRMPKRPASEMSPPRPRTQSRRAASKEALKQMQLLLDDENDAVEIPDDDVIPLDPSPPPPPPPKKKYKLSHRKSSDGNDRDVIVLKSITNRNAENTLELGCWVEQLEEAQQNRIQKYKEEEKELQEKLDMLINQCNGQVIHKGDLNTVIEVSEQVQNAIQGSQAQPAGLIMNNNLGGQQSYQLVVDPRVSLIVGAVSPGNAAPAQKVYQGKVQVAQNLQQTPATTSNQATVTRVATRNRNRASGAKLTPSTVVTPVRTSIGAQARAQTTLQTRGQATTQTRTQAAPQTRTQAATPQTRGQAVTQTRTTIQGKKQGPVVTARGKLPPVNTFTTSVRPDESNVQGGLATGGGGGKKVVVDLTTDDNNRTAPDSREISFNKLQGKTYPSLVVVARPHLRVQDLAVDRPKLDAKVKSVLMHAPTKFTEWLIQQGLIRSEQKCTVHSTTQLKLGMYSDVSKFPYSGGYVWISECCPQRFVSVFSGSLFEGSPHPPLVILKLLYHWSCQTNIQNVTQWVKVDNLYVKGMFTWLRSICTVAIHTHIHQIGGPGVKVEVGVISLGTTSQDGNQRQVKVEVLGVLESESKLIRLRAVEPQAEGDRNYKKRFSKILEPVCRWVHPQSVIVADLTVDKQTLINMGFQNVVQYSSNQYGNNNQIMEYLRRIVPRMFQNTLSLLSRQIIQQFLDELVWREWFGTSALQAFDNLVNHLSEQTRTENGQSLIVRLNKVAQNPFKSWAMNVGGPAKVVENTAAAATANANSNKKQRTARKPDPPKVPTNTPHTFLSSVKVAQAPNQDVQRPPKSTSPDVPEHMVPLESYYYGTIDTYSKTPKITLNMKCPFCKSMFDNNIQLMSHLFKHAHNVSMDAQLCRYCLTSVATANDLLKHIASSHPSETKFDNGFCCLICETQYMNPFVLGKHMSKEHCPSELPYQCGTCSYRCSNHKQAIDHFYRTHDNGPTIQCPFCLRSTTVFAASRNVVQNMNYFIQHLQKHQRKQFARRCGKCNLWFVQKDVLKDHQNKMHVSQRGKNGLVPWTAPRNGIMVPKSKMDKYPVDAEVINFAALKFDFRKGLVCKECDTPMDTPKHFPSFESCQNPNCQYSTCCTNAMQEHNAKCTKTTGPVSDVKLPFEMFCICGYSDTDGNKMARHLAICERKSAYPSRKDAKSATVTHSMLDVLGLVRKPEEKSRQKSKKSKKDPIAEDAEADASSSPASTKDVDVEMVDPSVKSTEEVTPVEESSKEEMETEETEEKQPKEDENAPSEKTTENKDEETKDGEAIDNNEEKQSKDQSVEREDEIEEKEDKQTEDQELKELEPSDKDEVLENIEKELEQLEASQKGSEKEEEREETVDLEKEDEASDILEKKEDKEDLDAPETEPDNLVASERDNDDKRAPEDSDSLEKVSVDDLEASETKREDSETSQEDAKELEDSQVPEEQPDDVEALEKLLEDSEDKEASEKDPEEFDGSEKDKEELEASEKDQEEFEASEKDKEELEASEKDKEDLGASEKDGEDLEASTKAEENLEASEKDLEVSEKDEEESAATERNEEGPEASEKDKVELEASEKDKGEFEASEKDEEELEASEKDKGEFEASEKDEEELDVSEKDKGEFEASEKDEGELEASEKDMEASDKETDAAESRRESPEPTEKEPETLDAIEKELSTFEKEETDPERQNHLAETQQTSEMSGGKEPAMTSDYLQSLLADESSAMETDETQPEDVKMTSPVAMMDVPDEGGEVPTPMETD